MKRFLIIGLIALSVVGITGCSSAERDERADAVPTVEPVVDPDGWDQEVSLDQFVAAFPEFDTSALIALEGITVQNNTRLWVLGTSDPDHSYEKAVAWAEDYVELQAEEGNDTVSGIYTDEDRSISIAIRQVGENSDTAGFLIYITGGIPRD